VFEQLVNSRDVTTLRYTQCNIVISLGTLEKYGIRIKSAQIQVLKGNISHAVAAIKITMLHQVYLNMIRRAQLCIDVGGNHFQHLL